MLSLVELSVHV